MLALVLVLVLVLGEVIVLVLVLVLLVLALVLVDEVELANEHTKGCRHHSHPMAHMCMVRATLLPSMLVR